MAAKKTFTSIVPNSMLAKPGANGPYQSKKLDYALNTKAELNSYRLKCFVYILKLPQKAHTAGFPGKLITGNNFMFSDFRKYTIWTLFFLLTLSVTAFLSIYLCS